MEASLKDVVDEILKVTCYFCNKYVNVPPIYVSEDGTKLKCGRCKDIECEINSRCLLYENIGKFLKFPCIYKTCAEFISWEKVETHEKMCAYSTMPCPIYYNCRMEIESEQLVNHMKAKHKQNYFEGKLTRNLTKDHRKVVVLLEKKIPFLIYLSEKKVCVTSMVPDTCSTYNLKLKGPLSPSLLYEHQMVNGPYEEVIHCNECIGEKCKRKGHLYSTLYGKKNEKLHYTSINFKHLNYVIGNYSELTFTIEIFFEEKLKRNEVENIVFSTNVVNPLKLNEPNNDCIWKNFECPICMEYMLTPIFNCQNGHSICNNCRSKLDICPSCQCVIGSSRNFPLENLANILKVPRLKKEDNSNCTENSKEVSISEMDCLKTE